MKMPKATVSKSKSPFILVRIIRLLAVRRFLRVVRYYGLNSLAASAHLTWLAWCPGFVSFQSRISDLSIWRFREGSDFREGPDNCSFQSVLGENKSKQILSYLTFPVREEMVVH